MGSIVDLTGDSDVEDDIYSPQQPAYNLGVDDTGAILIDDDDDDSPPPSPKRMCLKVEPSSSPPPSFRYSEPLGAEEPAAAAVDGPIADNRPPVNHTDAAAEQQQHVEEEAGTSSLPESGGIPDGLKEGVFHTNPQNIEANIQLIEPQPQPAIAQQQGAVAHNATTHAPPPPVGSPLLEHQLQPTATNGNAKRSPSHLNNSAGGGDTSAGRKRQRLGEAILGLGNFPPLSPTTHTNKNDVNVNTGGGTGSEAFTGIGGGPVGSSGGGERREPRQVSLRLPPRPSSAAKTGGGGGGGGAKSAGVQQEQKSKSRDVQGLVFPEELLKTLEKGQSRKRNAAAAAVNSPTIGGGSSERRRTGGQNVAAEVPAWVECARSAQSVDATAAFTAAIQLAEHSHGVHKTAGKEQQQQAHGSTNNITALEAFTRGVNSSTVDTCTSALELLQLGATTTGPSKTQTPLASNPAAPATDAPSDINNDIATTTANTSQSAAAAAENILSICALASIVSDPDIISGRSHRLQLHRSSSEIPTTAATVAEGIAATTAATLPDWRRQLLRMIGTGSQRDISLLSMMHKALVGLLSIETIQPLLPLPPAHNNNRQGQQQQQQQQQQRHTATAVPKNGPISGGGGDVQRKDIGCAEGVADVDMADVVLVNPYTTTGNAGGGSGSGSIPIPRLPSTYEQHDITGGKGTTLERTRSVVCDSAGGKDLSYKRQAATAIPIPVVVEKVPRSAKERLQGSSIATGSGSDGGKKGKNNNTSQKQQKEPSKLGKTVKAAAATDNNNNKTDTTKQDNPPNKAKPNNPLAPRGRQGKTLAPARATVSLNALLKTKLFDFSSDDPNNDPKLAKKLKNQAPRVDEFIAMEKVKQAVKQELELQEKARKQ